MGILNITIFTPHNARRQSDTIRTERVRQRIVWNEQTTDDESIKTDVTESAHTQSALVPLQKPPFSFIVHLIAGYLIFFSISASSIIIHVLILLLIIIIQCLT